MQLARRRLRVARYSIGAGTLAAFAAFGFAVRDAHPATHTPGTTAATASTATSSTATSSTATSSLDQSSNSFAISPAPSAAAPTIQSAGS
jgi:hypothetical protein